MASKEEQSTLPLYAIPAVGTCLTVFSGLSFLAVCMLLPMVGAAGAATTFASQNRIAFACYVSLSLLLSVAAIVSKVTRRTIDGSPIPVSSFALCALNLLILIALFAGWLSI